MSKIVNEARIKNKLIVRIRELLEHRAFWLYLLVDEAESAAWIRRSLPRRLSRDAAFRRAPTCRKRAAPKASRA